MKLLLLIISFLSVQIVSSKSGIDYKTKTSKEFPIKKLKKYSFIGLVDDKFICFKKEKKGGFFFKYNKEMQIVESQSIDLELNKFSRIKEIKLCGNEIHLFISVKNEKTNKKKLDVWKYDKYTLNFKTKDEIHNFTYPGKSFNVAGEYHYFESEDKSKISFLITHPSFSVTNGKFKRNPTLKCTIIDLDSTYKITSQKTHTLRENNLDRFVLFKNGILSNTGELYFIYEENNTGSKTSYMVTTKHILKNLNESMGLTNKQLIDFTLLLNKNNELFSLGYSISNDSNFNIFSKDNNGKINEAICNFNYQARIKSVIQTEDGFILFSEFNTLHSSRITNFGSTFTTTSNIIDNTYGNILATKFNDSGEIIWTKVITKWQSTSDYKGYKSSFSVITHQESIFILYNDQNIKELNKNYYSQTKLTKLNIKSGENETTVISTQNSYDKSIPRYSYFDKSNSYLYFAIENGKKNKLVRIYLE